MVKTTRGASPLTLPAGRSTLKEWDPEHGRLDHQRGGKRLDRPGGASGKFHEHREVRAEPNDIEPKQRIRLRLKRPGPAVIADVLLIAGTADHHVAISGVAEHSGVVTRGSNRRGDGGCGGRRGRARGGRAG